MKLRYLLLSWAAYWAGLLAVKLGPAVGPLLKATGREDGKGSVSAGFGGGTFNISIGEATTTLWHGSATLTSIALWIAIPPLLLWLIWIMTRPSHAEAPSQYTPHELSAVEADFTAAQQARDSIRSRDRAP